MRAIVPVNVTALRVNAGDRDTLTSGFQDRTAQFENMPYKGGRYSNLSSTGDNIFKAPSSTPTATYKLKAGIHLHWELPDFYRKGIHAPQQGRIDFPQVPNRWLVNRMLQVWDEKQKKWGAMTTTAFVVESDYLAAQPEQDEWSVGREPVSVPLSSTLDGKEKPYSYLGRVMSLDKWSKTTYDPSAYLPSRKDEQNRPLYLTAIGFTGPSFSSYYPDCSSVFGFWDHFGDQPDIHKRVRDAEPLKMRLSYQVWGWVHDPNADPVKALAGTIREQYQAYLDKCRKEGVPCDKKPAEIAVNVLKEKYGWEMRPTAISATTDKDQNLVSLEVPDSGICHGLHQEVVWDMLENPGNVLFLANPENTVQPHLWSDNVTLATGNTTVEAVAALMKEELGSTGVDDELLGDYEYLTAAFQLGLLKNVEKEVNKTFVISEELHSQAFARNEGGLYWALRKKQQQKEDRNKNEKPLPDAIALQLNLLNKAQKNYDQRRQKLLQIRRQIFLDWMRYIKQKMGEVSNAPYTATDIIRFLTQAGRGALALALAEAKAVGKAQYVRDSASGEITRVSQPAELNSLAYEVWNQFQALQAALGDKSRYEIHGSAEAPFWLASDPVLVMEGKRIEPVRRNGTAEMIAVRHSGEVVSTLRINTASRVFDVEGKEAGLSMALPESLPMRKEIESLQQEAALMIPSLVPALTEVLRLKGGEENPAVKDAGKTTESWLAALGGRHPSEDAGGFTRGLFGLVRDEAWKPAAEAKVEVRQPLELAFTWSNSGKVAWLASEVAWSAPKLLSEFTASRVDPFLPVMLVWNTRFKPLLKEKSLYKPEQVTSVFDLPADQNDYHWKGKGWTQETPIDYSGHVVLSRKPFQNMLGQFRNYYEHYPGDKALKPLSEVEKQFNQRRIMSQAMSGFGSQQNLRVSMPRVPVQNLMDGPNDKITAALQHATTLPQGDNWYEDSFNRELPISVGSRAQHNYGPLRTGYMGVNYLEVVDVFGQRLQLKSASMNRDGSLQVKPSRSLLPPAEDKPNAHLIYLPPRLEFPTRLWFKWLSAAHDPGKTPSANNRFEMNSHPGTTPVCGWVMPNHLDNSLMVYGADGMPIGSFNLEHGKIVYRTRAGNNANSSELQDDIGPEKAPTVNAHLAKFMWHVSRREGAWLQQLLFTIEASERHHLPVNVRRDAGLSVLVGQPLAITRALMCMESQGSALPLNQAAGTTTDAFAADVKDNRPNYNDREKTSTANIAGVRFPVRLGEQALMNDGLVGYFVEGREENSLGALYCPCYEGPARNDIQYPDPLNVQLTVNGDAVSIMMLMDARSSVYVTSGLLPTEKLEVPQEQYADAMRNLSATFFAWPILNDLSPSAIPLPEVAGFDWSWVTPGVAEEVLLKAKTSTQDAITDYSPQYILEGWLRLSPHKDTPTE